MGINLALGILYTWSMISAAIPAEWGWNEKAKSWPYSIACLVFSLVMVPAGRMQDKIGPRIVASIGGLLVGVGMILASMTTSYMGYVLGFGLLAGAGIGFGYASATPPAVKWFPAARTGLIAGIVVSGFGLASVYAAPLTQTLIYEFGLPNTMLILGIGFLVVVVVLAQLLAPPPKGYVPGGAAARAAAAPRKVDFAASEVLRTAQFYLLWFTYACGAGAGLMIIAKLKVIGLEQAGILKAHAFALVAACAIGNGAGRILAGTISDKLGRLPTLCGCLVVQAGLMCVLSTVSVDSAIAGLAPMMVLAALIGANYGANLALFPAMTKDFYGLKGFGMNYGLVFTAWGVGGFVLSLLAGEIRDRTGSFHTAYYVAAGLLVLAAMVTFAVKPPHAAQRATE